MANDPEDDYTKYPPAEARKSRGIAPEARMLARPTEPVTPTPTRPAQKSPPAKSKSSTESRESREAKRKNVQDDDPEYTPSKKLKKQNITSFVALTKPTRRKKDTEGSNQDATGSIGSESRDARPSFMSPRNRPTSPVTILDTTEEASKAVRTPEKQIGPSTAENGKSVMACNLPTPQNPPSLIDKLRAQKRLERQSSKAPTEQLAKEVRTYDQHSPASTSGPSDQSGQDQMQQVSNTDASALDQVIEGQANEEQVSSETAQTAAPVPQEVSAPQSSDPGIEIRYSIIASRIPRLVKRNWPVQSLSGKNVHDLFNEVSRFTSKADIQRIDFRLNLSQADSEYTIRRDDAKTFEAMKEEFADDIVSDWQANGNTKFSIWLEPDPVEQRAGVRDVGVDVENISHSRLRIAI